MDDLNKYYKNSLLNNLCSEYRGYWQSAHNDKRKLITLAMSQQAIPHFATYCYNGQGLTKDYIVRNFGNFINEKTKILDADGVDGYSYALYIAENSILTPSADVISLMWCTSTTVQIKTAKCPILYVSNKSEINLVLDGYNSIKIYLFDESKINIEDADDTCNATIYKYSDKCSVELGKFCLSKRIKQHNKELKL